MGFEKTLFGSQVFKKITENVEEGVYKAAVTGANNGLKEAEKYIEKIKLNDTISLAINVEPFVKQDTKLQKKLEALKKETQETAKSLYSKGKQARLSNAQVSDSEIKKIESFYKKNSIEEMPDKTQVKRFINAGKAINNINANVPKDFDKATFEEIQSYISNIGKVVKAYQVLSGNKDLEKAVKSTLKVPDAKTSFFTSMKVPVNPNVQSDNILKLINYEELQNRLKTGLNNSIEANISEKDTFVKEQKKFAVSASNVRKESLEQQMLELEKKRENILKEQQNILNNQKEGLKSYANKNVFKKTGASLHTTQSPNFFQKIVDYATMNGGTEKNFVEDMFINNLPLEKKNNEGYVSKIKEQLSFLNNISGAENVITAITKHGYALPDTISNSKNMSAFNRQQKELANLQGEYAVTKDRWYAEVGVSQETSTLSSQNEELQKEIDEQRKIIKKLEEVEKDKDEYVKRMREQDEEILQKQKNETQQNKSLQTENKQLREALKKATEEKQNYQSRIDQLQQTSETVVKEKQVPEQDNLSKSKIMRHWDETNPENANKQKVEALKVSETGGSTPTDTPKANKGLSGLKGKVVAVTTAVNEKNEAFIKEGQIVEGTVQAEITKLELLDGQLITIVETINKLTGHFKELEELAQKGFSTEDEVTDFNVLEGKIKEVAEAFTNISFDEKINSSLTSIKENITGFNTQALTDLSEHLSLVGKDNLAANIQKIANALLNLKSALNNLGNGGTTLLSDLKVLTEKGEELKNLVKLLGSSKNAISETKHKVDVIGDERKTRKQLQFENKTINDDKTSSDKEKSQKRNDEVIKVRDNKIAELKRAEETFISSITNFFDSNDKLVKSQIKYTEGLTDGRKRSITSTVHYTENSGAWSSDIVSDDYTQIQKNIENERKKTLKKVFGLQNQVIKYAEESHRFTEKQLSGVTISEREKAIYNRNIKKRDSARKNLDYYKGKIDQGEIVLTPEENEIYKANNKKYEEEKKLARQTSTNIRQNQKEKERLQQVKEYLQTYEKLYKLTEKINKYDLKGLTKTTSVTEDLDQNKRLEERARLLERIAEYQEKVNSKKLNLNANEQSKIAEASQSYMALDSEYNTAKATILERQSSNQKKKELFNTYKKLNSMYKGYSSAEVKMLQGKELTPKQKRQHNAYINEKEQIIREISVIENEVSSTLNEKEKQVLTDLKQIFVRIESELAQDRAEILGNQEIYTYGDYRKEMQAQARNNAPVGYNDRFFAGGKKEKNPEGIKQARGISPYEQFNRTLMEQLKSQHPEIQGESNLLALPFERGTEKAEEYRRTAEEALNLFNRQARQHSVMSTSRNNDNGSTPAVNGVFDLKKAEERIKNMSLAQGDILGMKKSSSPDSNGLYSTTVTVKNLNGEIKKLSYTYGEAAGQIYTHTEHVKTELSGIPKIFGHIKKKIGDLGVYWTAMLFNPYDLVYRFRQVYEAIKQMDSAFVEMRKVSNESLSDLKKFQQESFSIAKNLGTTSVELQQSVADWLRLGESLQQAIESAKASTTLLKVSEFTDINAATESLVSMSQAYSDLDKMDIVDKINNIGNNFSISTNKLAEGMQTASAALKSQGNTFEESLALITAGNSIVQDASQAAAGIRTISLRIAGTKQSKEQLEAAGEDTSGYVVATKSKLQQTIKNYTGVASNNYEGFDILDKKGNLKSTYDILLGISKIYKEIQLEDKKFGTNRANGLVETLAGKNRSNIAASILQSPDLLEKVYTTAQNSEGSAQAELEKQLDSVDSKAQKIANHIQEIIYNTFHSEEVKSVLDSVELLVNSFSKLTSLLKTFGTLSAVTFGYLGTKIKPFTRTVEYLGNHSIKLSNIKQGARQFISDPINSTKNFKTKVTETLFPEVKFWQGTKRTSATAKSLTREYQAFLNNNKKFDGLNLSEDFKKIVEPIKKADMGVTEFNKKLTSTLTLGQKAGSALKTSIAGIGNALTGAFIGAGIGMAVGAIINAMMELKDIEAKAKQDTKDFNSVFEQSISTLSDYKAKIEEIQNTISLSVDFSTMISSRKELLELQKEMIEKYGDEAEQINLVNAAIKGLPGSYEKLQQLEWGKEKKEFNKKENIFNKIAGAFTRKDYFTRVMEKQEKEASKYGEVWLSSNDSFTKDLQNKLKDFTKRYKGVTVTDDVVKISEGSLREKADIAEAIQKYINSITFSGSVQTNTKELREIADSDAQKTYENSVLYDKIFQNPQLYDYYEQLTKQKDKIDKAFTEHGEDSTQYEKSLKKYITLLSNITDNIDDKQVVSYFNNKLYPELQEEVGKWKFMINFSAEKIKLKDIQNAFGTDEDVLSYNEKTATREQRIAYSEYNGIKSAYNLSDDELIKLLIDKGILTSKVSKNFAQEFINKLLPSNTNLKKQNEKQDSYSNGINEDFGINNTDSNSFLKDVKLDKGNTLIKSAITPQIVDWYNKLNDEDKAYIEGNGDFIEAIKAKTESLKKFDEEAQKSGGVMNFLNRSLRKFKKDNKKPKKFSDAFNDENFATSKDKLVDAAKAGQLTPETLNTTKDYIDLLKETGLTAEETAKKIQKIADNKMLPGDWQERLTNIRSQASTTKNLLNELKTNGNSGDFVDGVLQSYPQLLGYLGDEERMRKELKNILKQQKDSMNEAYEQMVKDSEDYYTYLKEHENKRIASLNDSANAILSSNSALTDALGKGYKIDLNNFSTIAEAKLQIQKDLIKKSAKAWNTFYNVVLDANGKASVEQKENVTLTPSHFDTNGDYGAAVNRYVKKQREQKEAANKVKKIINQTIAGLDTAVKETSNITLSKNTGSGSKSKNNNKNKDSLSKFSQTIDWCEKTITKLSNTVSLINTKLENTSLSLSTQLKYYQSLITAQSTLAKGYSKEAEFYGAYYKSKLKKLSKSDQKKVEDGSYTVSLIKGKTKSGKTSKAEKRYNKILKALEARDNYTQAKINSAQSKNQLAEYYTNKAAARWTKAAEKVEKINKKNEITNKQVTNAKNLTEKNNYVTQSVEQQQTALSVYQQAYSKDKNKKKSLLAKLNKKNQGLVDKNTKLIDVSKITAKTKKNLEAQKKIAQEYNAMVKQLQEAGLELQSLQEDYTTAYNNAFTTKAENIVQDYSNRLSMLENSASVLSDYLDLIQAKEKIANNGIYDALIQNSKNKTSQYQEEINMLKSLQSQATQYSQVWYDLEGKIQEAQASQRAELKTQIEYLKTQTENVVNLHNAVNQYLQDYSSEVKFIQGLLNESDIYDKDTGNLTNKGLASVALGIADYEDLQKQVQQTTEAIRQLDNMYANDQNNAIYLDSRRELINTYQQEVTGAKEAKQAVSDLIVNGYNKQAIALQKLIDKKKQSLEVEKSEYEYQKTITEKTKNLSNLEKQQKLLGGNNSEEARAKRQSLEEQIRQAKEDIEETQYEKYIERQENYLDTLQDNFAEIIESLENNIDENFKTACQAIEDNKTVVANGLTEIQTNLLPEGFADSITQLTTAANNNGSVISAINNTLSAIVQNGLTVIQATASDVNAVQQTSNSGYEDLNNTITSNGGSAGGATTIENSFVPQIDPVEQDRQNKLAVIQDWMQNYSSQYLEKNGKKGKNQTKTLDDYHPLNQAMVRYAKDIGVISKLNSQHYSAAGMFDLAYQLGTVGSNWKLSEDQKNETLRKWQFAFGQLTGYSTGGYLDEVTSGGVGGVVASVIKRNHDDGIATFKKGEAILSPTQTDMFKDMLNNLDTFTNLQHLLKNGSNINSGSVSVENINLEFNLPNVVDSDSFIKAIKNDTSVQRVIREATIGQLNNVSKFSVNRIL